MRLGVLSCPVLLMPILIPSLPEPASENLNSERLEPHITSLQPPAAAFSPLSQRHVRQRWRILSAARCHGLGLRIHADQFSISGGVQVAAELTAATADHLEYTDAAGIAALKSAEVQPVLLPGAVYALGLSRYPPAREMINAGLAVVLATDFNPGSSPTTSMLTILSLASTHLKMTPAESLTASTINAAFTLGRGDQLGSLEAGKLADFVIHDCDDYRELSYFFGVEHAWKVYKRGRLAFTRDGLVDDPR